MNGQQGVRISAVLGLFALACAQATPPPGGVEDRLPPRIIETIPDTFAVLESLDGPVVFRFSERISERNITDRSAMVSPRTGDVRVRRGRDEVRVEIEGGWQPGRVYRIILLPGVRDLFGNELKASSELVFSTGPEISSAVIAGVVTDRITGRSARQVYVMATPRGDSLGITVAADSSAFFAVTHLDPGIYDMFAYSDVNRNGRHDASEPSARNLVVPVNRATDTALVELAVVPADTIPPRLTRAEVADSTQIRLHTDDYLDPEADLDLVEVTILSLPDSVLVPGRHALMTVDSFNALPKPESDSLSADSLAADTTVVDSTFAGRPVIPAEGRARAPAGAAPLDEFGPSPDPLPFQEVVLVPATALRAGEKYLIQVLGFTNISGRSGGGGEQEIEIPEPPPPPPDTSAVRLPSGTGR